MSNITTHKQFLTKPAVIERFSKMLGVRKANAFITSVMQVISNNDLLAKADTNSIFHAAATAASLDLPINNNLGFAYIVPYKGKAQFQLGWKGLVQLAQRSGQFRTISATKVYEGQLIDENPLEGFTFNFKVKGEKVIGYAAYFELLNGYKATYYMSVDEVKEHAKKYSQSYGKSFSAWTTDFDSMAEKTVLKRLLSRFAPLSTEMQKAVIADQAVIKNSDDDAFEVIYEDNIPDAGYDRFQEFLSNCKTAEDFETLRDSTPVEYHAEIDARMAEVLK